MSGYYDNVRSDLLPFLPSARNLRVLELGCGEGRTGAYLKSEGIAGRVVGAEYSESAAERAREVLDVVHCVDLNTFDGFEERFDLILAPDVIEHLMDPWAVIGRVVSHLEVGGWLITSTPNIRYWKVIWELAARGRWEYTDAGIMDRTHLRFFTRSSIEALHRGAGMEVEELGYPELSGKRALLDRAAGGRLRDVLGGQHVVRSVKRR